MMEHCGIKRVFLNTSQPGYGRNDCELLVTSNNPRSATPDFIRQIHNLDTDALVLLDDSHKEKIRHTLDWIGERTEYITSLSLKGNFSCEDISSYMNYYFAKIASPTEIATHTEILFKDVKTTLETMKPVFNLASGFYIDIIKKNITSPEWHNDFSTKDGPDETFIRAVRCATEQGTWLSLKDYTDRPPGYIPGTGYPIINVHGYAYGGAGLYVLKGNKIHSIPVTGKNPARTIYTLTPAIHLDPAFRG